MLTIKVSKVMNFSVLDKSSLDSFHDFINPCINSRTGVLFTKWFLESALLFWKDFCGINLHFNNKWTLYTALVSMQASKQIFWYLFNNVSFCLVYYLQMLAYDMIYILVKTSFVDDCFICFRIVRLAQLWHGPLNSSILL